MAQGSRLSNVKDNVREFVGEHKKGICIAAIGTIATAEAVSYALTGRELLLQLFNTFFVPRGAAQNMTPTVTTTVTQTVTSTVKTTVVGTIKSATTTVSPKVFYDLKSLLDAQQAVGSISEMVMEKGRVYASYINSKAVEMLLQRHNVPYTGGGGTVEVLYDGAVNRIQARLLYGGGKTLPVTIEDLQWVADPLDKTDKITWIVKEFGRVLYQTTTVGLVKAVRGLYTKQNGEQYGDKN